MSVAIVVGMLGLANGIRCSESNGSSQTFYCYYDSALHCSQTRSAPAQIRVYSPKRDQVLPNDTVAFVIAKAYFERGGTILLDTQPQQFFPIPGDPSDEHYLDHVPEFSHPMLFAVGRVCPTSSGDSVASPVRRFDLAVSEYVRNSTQHSTVELACDTSTLRWANTPTPSVNTGVGVLAVASGVTTAGVMRFDLLSLALNVSPSVAVGGGTLNAGNGGDDAPSLKRKRFSAYASDERRASTPIHASPHRSDTSAVGDETKQQNEPSAKTIAIEAESGVTSSTNAEDISIQFRDECSKSQEVH
ncbi:hypothetical protein CONPUDRAFT_150645 [Coniophora puteana RWD-64-598 SS2]|uniref:Uncharacterized protein n=1 Tax=Coniophora puteana (strain RWD-64-598) TaxID=741705 RepID=A0A5M3N3A1_CONPW|nr:uncharacterized protein CONPUDRAFT_150645 [Coniophora puteana RWD-64-598 SS2]EIW85870.1 hypothetical protein CONPUDRAFT_150645 [Coniophora puteana RWD-64-598 SS2]